MNDPDDSFSGRPAISAYVDLESKRDILKSFLARALKMRECGGLGKSDHVESVTCAENC
jgi:hypothetical protein